MDIPVNDSKQMNTVLCGIGGYGEAYLSEFFGQKDSPLQFTGFVDPMPEKAVFYDRIRTSGLPVFSSIEECYASLSPELMILSTPIQLHADQTICALEHGSHVLCEKPLCGSVADAGRMLEAQRRCGRVVAIGYQDSYVAATQKLKADILSGLYGKPVLLKCLVMWPRSLTYFNRSRWAGRICDEQGRPVMDSPLNNATAHHIHHMLYLLGDEPGRSAVPAEVQAVLCRANAIENYDTAFLRCTTRSGAKIFFVTGHAMDEQVGPVFELVFERGVVRSSGTDSVVAGRLNDGTEIVYGKLGGGNKAKVLDTVDAIRSGRESLCGIEAAMSHTLCMEAAQASGAPVYQFPADMLQRVEKEKQTWVQVPGLSAVMKQAYAEARLPDARMAPWAVCGRTIAVDQNRR